MPVARSIVSGDVQFKVLLQLGDVNDVPAPGLWDVGQWDVSAWGAQGDAYMIDVTEYCLGFSTTSGRQTYTSRFRAGKASIDLDNTHGEWTPAGGNQLPGFLPLRPGRVVQIFAMFGESSVQIYEGYVDVIADRYTVDGDLTTRITALDLMGLAPAANTVEQPSQGSGESSGTRFRRILDHEFPFPTIRRVLGESADDGTADTGNGTKMQATTLAADALQLLQITADSEGGGVWQAPNGYMTFSLSEFFTDQAAGDPDWLVGGASPIAPIGINRTDWSMQRIINEAHMASAGGTEQVAINSGSQGVFGIRTHRRLDLQTFDDVRPDTLAQKIVSNLAFDRAQVTGMTIQPDNEPSYLMGSAAQFGDKVILTVDTIFGWSYTVPTQIFGISHDVTPDTWQVHFLLDDTEVQLQGAFTTGFSDGYDV